MAFLRSHSSSVVGLSLEPRTCQTHQSHFLKAWCLGWTVTADPSPATGQEHRGVGTCWVRAGTEVTWLPQCSGW